MSLRITTHETKPSYFTIALEGELDAITHTQLEDHYLYLRDSGARALHFNMAGLNYISSMGLRVMLRIMKEVKANKLRFMMTNLQPPVRKIFDIANALPSLGIFKSVREADEYFDLMQAQEREKQQSQPGKQEPGSESFD